MLKNKEAIIFDLDGSLVDSMWIWPKVDEIYMEKYKIRAPESFYQDIEGKSYTECAQYFLDTFPTLNCSLEEIKQEWTEMTLDLYMTSVILKPGALEFIEKMRRNGILLGIATSNTRELAEAALNSQKVAGYFSSVRTACEVAAGKPSPDVYLKVAEDLKVNPNKCLVFEDVPNGIAAGKNAGMEVCAVADDFSKSYEAEKRRLADYYITDYYDIKNCTYEICR